ncbi:MAG: hydratase [Clostridiaceae bacterium]|jgi:aconitate hydratase|nr:hydratase [Clostridiaceae bacterium]
MVKLTDCGVFYINGEFVPETETFLENRADAYKRTIAYGILNAHNTAGAAEKGKGLKLKFDAMASHDITYVGIIQTAKASGLKQFPMPYVLTNCHNSLCAVGGTINEDDHMFGLSAAKKYGGIYVPAHMAVIHTYMRECFAGCGKMILGSDSHTRYGALGTLAIGEGGPELAKQLLNRTYDTTYPDVVAVELKGRLRKGVGPQDVALALIGAVFKSGFVKNKILEFVGEGIDVLSAEFRNGIDVMTTETACLSSVWKTDRKVQHYLEIHGRGGDYKELAPENGAYYDGLIEIDLNAVEPMIALPFHPSNVYKLADVLKNPYDIFRAVEAEGKKIIGNPKINFNLTDKIERGFVKVSQGIIAGCAGGIYDNIIAAENILRGYSIGNGEFTMSVYPSSVPVYNALMKNGLLSTFVEAGAIVKTAFCGPCFGAGDVPANNGFSIRHTTRNFENREGSKPGDNQIASVALMDARSIAATARNGGILTSALEVEFEENKPRYFFDGGIYARRVFDGYKNGDASLPLFYGPNIADWPEIAVLADNLILKVAAAINDPVTTTDELIPSGETSSYRSNPMRLAEFTLSRKCPDYVSNAKKTAQDAEAAVKNKKLPDEYKKALAKAGLKLYGNVSIGSAVYAKKPGDGSAREQAASCQRVLGGAANIAKEYATKRYRSNLINWGMLPFISDTAFEKNDIIIVPDVKKLLKDGAREYEACVVRGTESFPASLWLDPLTDAEREIIVKGCLINYYKE